MQYIDIFLAFDRDYVARSDKGKRKQEYEYTIREKRISSENKKYFYIERNEREQGYRIGYPILVECMGYIVISDGYAQ